MNSNKFLEVFKDSFDSNEITMESKLEELEFWDSMSLLIVIAMFDSKFNLRVSGADVRNCTTVNDLYKLLPTD